TGTRRACTTGSPSQARMRRSAWTAWPPRIRNDGATMATLIVCPDFTSDSDAVTAPYHGGRIFPPCPPRAPRLDSGGVRTPRQEARRSSCVCSGVVQQDSFEGLRSGLSCAACEQNATVIHDAHGSAPSFQCKHRHTEHTM